ncbi:transcriptional repressor [Candidatus Woesearchaeota archaeon]|nr:MAG: transcriptional repressor [Candidatus Woesearchaeota archaeon]
MLGTRTTCQRIKILDYLKSVKTHPTAEEIYKAVRKDLPAISLATVYRNLNLLVDQGIIFKLMVKNEAHFDAGKCSHQHFICRNCGEIIDIHNKKITNYALKKVASPELKPDCVKIIYEGLCKHCERGDKK